MKRFIVEVPDSVTEEELIRNLYNGFDVIQFTVHEVRETWETANGAPRMTTAQRDKLWDLCGRYNVPFRENDYHRVQWSADAPIMYEGWIGGFTPIEHPTTKQIIPKTIYVGVEPNGDSHS